MQNKNRCTSYTPLPSIHPTTDKHLTHYSNDPRHGDNARNQNETSHHIATTKDKTPIPSLSPSHHSTSETLTPPAPPTLSAIPSLLPFPATPKLHRIVTRLQKTTATCADRTTNSCSHTSKCLPSASREILLPARLFRGHKARHEARKRSNKCFKQKHTTLDNTR